MKRYIELDLLRSAAIAGMIVYHAAYDLQSFYGWDTNVFTGGWKLFQIAVASLFLLLAGVTSSFANRRPWKRFARIGTAALLVTATTYVIDPDTYVRFGILHLIALSALLLLPLSRFRLWLLIPGVLLIVLGPWIGQMSADTPFFLPLGVTYLGFVTVDYFPLIPWFGVVLIGYSIGYTFYVRFADRRTFRSEAKQPRSYATLSWPGQHSLAIYLLHQPVIIAILWLTLGRPNL
jgi:uncharacterized membrane protein